MHKHPLTGSVELTLDQLLLVNNLGIDGEKPHLIDIRPEANGGFFFFTQQLAERVLVRYLGTMKVLMAQEHRDGFAVVIADPDGRILLIYVEGDPRKWKYSYLSIALSKCRMALKNQRNTRSLPAVFIRKGDTPCVGGVWMGFPLAVSGFTEEVDEDFGREIAEVMTVLAEADRRSWEKQHPNAHSYE